MVASSQPCMGILRCDSRVVISLDLAARACCPCWTYAGDTRLLAKVRLAEFILRTASYIPDAPFHTSKRGRLHQGLRPLQRKVASYAMHACSPRLGVGRMAEAYAQKATMLVSKPCRQELVRRPDTYIRVLLCMQNACNAAVHVYFVRSNW